MTGGPLSGLTVVEIASLAPAPFGCMILADLGADVIRVERAGDGGSGLMAPSGVLDRGRRSIAVNLRTPEGLGAVLRLVEGADILVEGFRPGVAERLGIGPDDCLSRNPGLIYGRMTGWGQHGPLAPRAGHDINYIALAGALEPIGRAGERPVPPLNLLGDFGGGGLMLAMGILAALHERSRSGRGQVVDASMVDGAALLTAFVHGMNAAGLWQEGRGQNVLDGAAAFYDTYACADGLHVAVGCVEPHFYGELLDVLGLSGEDLPSQYDLDAAPELKKRLADVFATRPRDDWAAVFADSNACVSPVLSPWEAHEHPHDKERETFVEVGGIRQPAPAPRFSRTPAPVPRPAPRPGQDTDAILAQAGYDPSGIEHLRSAGAVE
ncbi:alpha-methylacyl-CoA racemase [Rhodococcus wratislaviensis]|uniref:Alpha-methylacyl-CoA racemase n=1 Tax=Rhodococcus wratislaviensis TaxID=44752 RepID=A0AB38FIF8_RHOWR|nr:CaiB/BaiF CoA-transferase family protein [Rhodococcus wratislaviensis]REE73377.1 alpha-methylacyl-CoA racemase [Rhodococcus wratislaviensis]SPZ41232.1 alpha-methylacyl-CoA racemase [Rhodococcus wratislaviensis]